MTGRCHAWHEETNRLAQPTLGPVAPNRITDPAAGSKADPDFGMNR